MSNSIAVKNDLLGAVNRLHLHLYHFARGVYPAAAGEYAALPVNRCLMPLGSTDEMPSYIDDRKEHFILRPGHVYFIPAYYRAGVKLTENMRFISIQFLLDFHNNIDLFSHFGKIVEIENSSLVSRADQAFDTEDVHLLGVRLHSLVFEFVGLLFEKFDTAKFNIITQGVSAELNMLSQTCTAQTTVAELAEQSGLCRDAFSRRFICRNGISPKQFLNYCILHRAYSLLSAGELKIHEVARELKFTNEFYFSRFFKKHANITPSQFRKKFIP